jgi:hypothetical protein
MLHTAHSPLALDALCSRAEELFTDLAREVNPGADPVPFLAYTDAAGASGVALLPALADERVKPLVCLRDIPDLLQHAKASAAVLCFSSWLAPDITMPPSRHPARREAVTFMACDTAGHEQARIGHVRRDASGRPTIAGWAGRRTHSSGLVADGLRFGLGLYTADAIAQGRLPAGTSPVLAYHFDDAQTLATVAAALRDTHAAVTADEQTLTLVCITPEPQSEAIARDLGDTWGRPLSLSPNDHALVLRTLTVDGPLQRAMRRRPGSRP